jgi:4-diphosphocytidyl-2-C-methyl-D-erythritol kinase
MRIQHVAGDVVVWAPAKVNLFLEVLAKRADGYHDVATLMATVSLCDTLVLRQDASGGVRLHCNLPTLSTGSDNLVTRAALLLRRHTGCQQGADIQLVKRIPLAAGLAGGSSDAAAALAGLNGLWNLGRKAAELATLAAELGSDVPFFFASPAAWCTGRGEQVAPLALGGPMLFVLACPRVGLATAAVYRDVRVPERPLTGTAILEALARGDVEASGRCLHNRLQQAAEQLCPAVASLHQRLARLNPAGVLMSGSGSTVFALCRDRKEALRIARELCSGQGEQRPQVFVVRSCA